MNETNPVRLTLGNNGGGFRVWKDAARSELLLGGSVTSVNFTSKAAIPASVFLEAQSATSQSSRSALSISYSYNEKSDYSSSIAYAIGANDSMALNAFNVDVYAGGVTNETQVTDTTTNPTTPIRRLLVEEFPGGEYDIAPTGTAPGTWMTASIEGEETPRRLYLISLSLTGSNLTRITSYLTAEEQAAEQLRELSFTCASDKVEFYERLKNTNGSWQTDAAGNAVYRKRPNSFNIKVSELSALSGTLYLCPVEDSGSKRDIKLELSYTAPLGGKTHKDTVQLTNLHLDVDVDSNNDGTVSTDDRTEDDIETTAPGKVVLLNTSDRDGDGVVDRYDWEITGNGFNEPLFEELHLNLPESINLDNYKIGVSYAAAPPPLPGDANQQPSYTQYQNLRLWTKQSNTLRDTRPVGGVNQTGEVGGDYVAPTTWGGYNPQTGTMTEAYYTSEQLGLENRGKVLYIEGVNANPNGAVSISVTLTPIVSRPGTTVVMPEANLIPETVTLNDSAIVAVADLSLDTDSDNSGAIDLGWKEKSLKNKDGRPGKFVRANLRNHDDDLLVDYADLSNAAAADFVTGQFYLSTPYPLSDLRIKVLYEGAASLGSFPDEATVTTLEEYASLRGADMLRLWVDWTPTQTNTDGTEHRRDPVNYTGETNATGNYLPPGVLFNADKFFRTYASNKSGTRIFYVEGLNGGPTTVTVEVYYKDGRLLGRDEIKFTVTDLQLRVNSKNDMPNTFGGWTPTFEESMIQEKVGKIVELNCLDRNSNSTPDYLETDITEASVRLVPMLLTLSTNDVMEDLRVKFIYNGDASCAGTVDIFAEGENPENYQPVRIWVAEKSSKIFTRNFQDFAGYRPNLAEDANFSDYLQPGIYYRADKIMKSGANEYKVLLWVEGVTEFNAEMVDAELAYEDPDAVASAPQMSTAMSSESAPQTRAAMSGESMTASSANAVTTDPSAFLIPVNEKRALVTPEPLQLAVDLNNDGNWGFPLSLEWISDTKAPLVPGKILFTNEGDDDNDGVVDYASLWTSGETNLVPVVLIVEVGSPDLYAYSSDPAIAAAIQQRLYDMGILGATLTISYDGLANLNDVEFFPDEPVQKTDYAPKAKKGTMRLWASPAGFAPVITPSSLRSKLNFGTKNSQTGEYEGNYLAPGSYPLNSFLWQEYGRYVYTILYAEGINQKAAAQEISVTLRVNHVVSNRNGVVNKKANLTILEGNITGNVNDDPTFILDSADDIYEDQKKGFHCWYYEGAFDPWYGLESTFPFKAVRPSYSLPPSLVMEFLRF